MPIYEFQTQPNILRRRGPVFPVQVSIPQILIDYLQQRGQSIPQPVSGFALIDTGASITVIDLNVLNQLGINPVGVARVLTPAGPVQQNLFPARLIFGPGLVIDLSVVIGANLRPQQIIALIGRDILSKFIMIYHGRSGRITIAF